jgi:hypothetical protein
MRGILDSKRSQGHGQVGQGINPTWRQRGGCPAKALGEAQANDAGKRKERSRFPSLHKGPPPQVKGFKFFFLSLQFFTTHVFIFVACAVNCLYLNIFFSSTD